MDFVRILKDDYDDNELKGLSTSALRYALRRGTESVIRSRILDRHELIDRASSRGRIWQYGSQERFTIDPPASGLHPALEAKVGTRSVRRPFVAEIPDATIVNVPGSLERGRGHSGIARTSDKQILIETFATDAEYFMHHCSARIRTAGAIPTVAELFLTENEPVSESVELAVDLTTRHPNNFAHWLMEDLRMLRGIEYYREKTGNEPTVIVDQDLPGWVDELLRIFGYPPSARFEWNYEPLHVSRLVIPIYRPMSSAKYEPTPSDHKWVRDTIMSAVDYRSHLDDFSDRVLVSRQGQDRRRVFNHEELEAKLTALGFKSYRPEEMTRSEQVALFANAEIVVNPHGSSGNNILFSDNLSYIELFPPDRISPAGMEVAGVLNHTYDYVIGRRSDETSVGKVNDRKDYTVDSEKVIKSIHRVADKKVQNDK